MTGQASPRLVIEDVDAQGEVALALLREAALDARALYPEAWPAGAPWPTNPPWPEGGVYVAVQLDDVPVACGALLPLDSGTAEVRRMYVHRGCRRHGLGRLVLQHLVERARGLGYRTLLLETGHLQLPAMALYVSEGFRPVAPFGAYADDPLSRCFRRDLT